MALTNAPFSFYIGLAGIAFTFLIVANTWKHHDRRAFQGLLRFGLAVAGSIAIGLLIPGLLVLSHRIALNSSLVSGGTAFTILAVTWSMREARRSMAMVLIERRQLAATTR